MWSKDLFSSISTTMWLTEDRPVPLLIPAPFRMDSQNGNLTFPPLRTYRVTAAMARGSDSGGRQRKQIRHEAMRRRVISGASVAGATRISCSGTYSTCRLANRAILGRDDHPRRTWSVGSGGAMDSRSEAEFAEFMHGRWPALVRLGYGLTGDERLAEDLARAALAKAYASWPRVLRAGDPDVYLRRIILNASLGKVRRRRVRERRPGDESEPETAQLARVDDDRPALVTALMRLPVGQRSVVLLRYWMDMTEAQVAAVLGCSVGSVRSQASRALASLRVGEDVAEEVRL
jgi:RNA polymerase sigma-70 factor (sigma-E family)